MFATIRNPTRRLVRFYTKAASKNAFEGERRSAQFVAAAGIFVGASVLGCSLKKVCTKIAVKIHHYVTRRIRILILLPFIFIYD